jgi:hypothetical protein
MQPKHILAKQCTREHAAGRPRTRAPAAACFRLKFRVRCARESCFPARIIFFLLDRCKSQTRSLLADALICSFFENASRWHEIMMKRELKTGGGLEAFLGMLCTR